MSTIMEKCKCGNVIITNPSGWRIATEGARGITCSLCNAKIKALMDADRQAAREKATAELLEALNGGL